MAYTVNALITGAYYKSGIVSREFGTVSGSQMSAGLSELNKALSTKTVQKWLIPYYTNYTFPAVVDQEQYSVPGLIEVSTLTFTLNSIRYPVIPRQRQDYFGSARANNVSTLPYTFHMERNLGGANIFLYFKPNQAYPFELWGKFRLASVAYNQDLELTHDLFYIDFLETALAKRLCNEFNFTVPSGVEESLKEFYQQFKDQISPLDMTCTKSSTLGDRSGVDIYVEANIAQGWRP